jgi:hypothetical protein
VIHFCEEVICNADPPSNDLRERVVAFVEAGHSRRAAAAHFRVSPSFVVNLMTLFRQTALTASAKACIVFITREANDLRFAQDLHNNIERNIRCTKSKVRPARCASCSIIQMSSSDGTCRAKREEPEIMRRDVEG